MEDLWEYSYMNFAKNKMRMKVIPSSSYILNLRNDIKIYAWPPMPLLVSLAAPLRLKL